jgi:hypothetical protein
MRVSMAPYDKFQSLFSVDPSAPIVNSYKNHKKKTLVEVKNTRSWLS